MNTASDINGAIVLKKTSSPTEQQQLNMGAALTKIVFHFLPALVDISVAVSETYGMVLELGVEDQIDTSKGTLDSILC